MTGEAAFRALAALPAFFVARRAAAIGALAALPFSVAAGNAPVLRLDVAASCERKAAKGRVLCDVEFEVPDGRIAWADVVVVQAPPFAKPLRSRVGVLDARSRTERRVHIPVAFVAEEPGRGAVAFRGRAVVCARASEKQACVPVVHDATAELKVGAEEEH